MKENVAWTCAMHG